MTYIKYIIAIILVVGFSSAFAGKITPHKPLKSHSNSKKYHFGKLGSLKKQKQKMKQRRREKRHREIEKAKKRYHHLKTMNCNNLHQKVEQKKCQNFQHKFHNMSYKQWEKYKLHHMKFKAYKK